MASAKCVGGTSLSSKPHSEGSVDNGAPPTPFHISSFKLHNQDLHTGERVFGQTPNVFWIEHHRAQHTIDSPVQRAIIFL